jgi:hypothetical protein
MSADYIIQIILNVSASGGITYVVMKAHLMWIIRTLDDHSKDHENHYKEIDYLKGKIYAKR